MTTPKPGLPAVREIPYSPVIGHTSQGPVFRAAGGRAGSGSGIDFIVGDDDGDDPEFDDEGDDEGDEDDDYQADPRARRQRREPDDDDSHDEDWQPPDRTAWEAMETALQRANREAMNRRRVGKVMDRFGVADADGLEDFLRSRGIDPSTGERGGEGDDGSGTDEPADDGRPAKGTITKAQYEREKLRAEQRGLARAETKYKDATILLAAENALRGAGWSGENLNLALRLIDPDRVDITMDGGELVIDGLEEQIAEVKDEFPNWFRPAVKDRNANRRRESAGARAVDGGNRDRPPPRKLGWAAQLSRQIDQGR